MAASLVRLVPRHGKPIAEGARSTKDFMIAIVIVDGRFNLAIHILGSDEGFSKRDTREAHLVFFHHDFINSVVVILVVYERGVHHRGLDAFRVDIVPPLHRIARRFVMGRRTKVASFPIVNVNDTAALFHAPVLIMHSSRLVIADNKVVGAAILGQIALDTLILLFSRELVGCLERERIRNITNQSKHQLLCHPDPILAYRDKQTICGTDKLPAATVPWGAPAHDMCGT